MQKKAFLRFSIVFAAVYFFSLNGLASLPNLSLSFLLKEKLKQSAGQLAYFQAITLLAWVVKPLWGFISDSFPIFGYRRKSYLVISSALAAASWITLSLVKSFSMEIILAAISVAYMAYAFQDVVADGLMVEAGKRSNLTGKFQSIQWAAVYSALILTALFGGFVSDLSRKGTISYQSIFGITAIFPALTLLICAFFVDEEKRDGLKAADWNLVELVKQKNIWLLAFFLFFWNFSPSFGAPFFYYSVDTLKFSGAFLGILQAVTSAAGLLGSIFYAKLIEKIPVRKFLVFAVFAGVFVILLNYLFFVPYLVAHANILKVLALATNFVFGIFNTFIFLALLNLAAKVSPEYAGGTVFAFLMSFYNLGLMGSSAAGGALFAWVGLKLLILISAFFSLIVLLFLPALPIPEELTAVEKAIARGLKRLRER